MINHGIIKKDGKVTGYRTPQSDLYTGQIDWVNLAQKRNKDLLNEAERLLDSWAYWRLRSGHSASSLINLEKDFTNPSESMIPAGVEITKNVAEALRIFGSMRDANQLSYIVILQAVHLARGEDRSIERVIKKLKDHGRYDFNRMRYNRAKKTFSSYL